jgi:hypothetical protein
MEGVYNNQENKLRSIIETLETEIKEKESVIE